MAAARHRRLGRDGSVHTTARDRRQAQLAGDRKLPGKVRDSWAECLTNISSLFTGESRLAYLKPIASFLGAGKKPPEFGRTNAVLHGVCLPWLWACGIA